MSKFNVGGLTFSSFELAWIAGAVIVIVVVGYLMMTGLPVN
jgi:hypothetical protein